MVEHQHSHSPKWAAELCQRIKYLSSKQNGWKGERSKAANQKATVEAQALVQKLAREEITSFPGVGLDEEGSYSFFWKTGKLLADLTVYGDGTYSFFTRRGQETVQADAAKLSEPFPRDLIRLLTD